MTTFMVDGAETEFLDTDVENNIEYHYSIRGSNKYGRGVLSSEIMVTPDGTPPLLEILSPFDGTIFNQTTLMFNWTGADDISFDHFEIRIDDSEWIPQGDNLSANISHISEGVHTFYLAGEDSVGNRNEVNISFTVDLTLPTAWFTMIPDDGDLIINSTSMELTWNGSDDVGVAGYEIGVDGGQFIEIDPIFSYLLTNLTEGGHSVRIKVWDLAGNFNITIAMFEVDLTAPVVHIVWPVDGYNTTDRSFNATWFTIEEYPLPYYHSIKIDDGEWIDLDQATEHPITNLSVGVHNIVIRAMDSAGNMGINSSTFQVFEDEIPPELVTINGRVVDEDGDPISGVKITSDDGYETSTDSDGEFIIQVEKGPRTFKFEKNGYEDWTKSFDANDTMDFPDGDITLEKKEEKERFLTFRRFCLICCGAPMVLLLVLILIGLFIRITKKAEKDLYRYEE
jgi:hypothetical protein